MQLNIDYINAKNYLHPFTTSFFYASGEITNSIVSFAVCHMVSVSHLSFYFVQSHRNQNLPLQRMFQKRQSDWNL